MLTAFRLSREISDAGRVYEIFRKEFEELAQRTRKFAADLISKLFKDCYF
jgi:hypothetical protein